MKLAKWNLVAAAVIALAGAGFTQTANADVVFEFNANYTGDAPAGTPEWLKMTFVNDGANQVKLTIEASLQDSDEFISKLFFNLDPAFNATNLVFSNPIKTGSFDLPSITKGVNINSPGSAGNYDIILGFETSNSGGGSKRYNNSDKLEYTLSGIVGLNETSFSFAAADAYLAEAHVQGIEGQAGSGKIYAEEGDDTSRIPEPASLGVLGLGALALMARRRK